MNSKWPNILCLAGVSLIGWSLFTVHPALCASFAGSALTLLGAILHRQGKKPNPTRKDAP